MVVPSAPPHHAAHLTGVLDYDLEAAMKELATCRVLSSYVTYSLDEQFPFLAYYVLGEPNLVETDVLIHLLRVFRIEGTPAATHFEQEHAQ